MKKPFAFIFTMVVVFLLMVASFLLPVLCDLPLWAEIACIVYKLAYFSMLLVFFAIQKKNNKPK